MLSWRSSNLPTLSQGAASNYKDLLSEQGVRRFREALGRSRGGLTTKIHLAADQRCRPIAFLTSEGQRHDSIAFEMVLAEVRIDRVGPGRPRTRPDWVLADKAYSSKANRDHLAGRGIKAAIPIKDDQAAGRRKKGSAGGRPPDFDKQRYRDRNTVERAVNKLRGCRATATRYDKRDYVYRGTIAVTSISIWIRNPSQAGLSDTS
jgi:transposase